MSRKALIVVDVQNDFCPGGSLAVNNGDKVVEPLNKIIEHADRNGWLIIFSRDWHPEKTSHFKQNPEDPKGWPVHCVQGTPGAEFHKDLNRIPGSVVISKGTEDGEDAYSAFEGRSEYGNSLETILRWNGVGEVYIGGLATDYCVKATVLDAIMVVPVVCLLLDACRAVNLKPGDGEAAIAEMNIYCAEFKTIEEVINEMDN